MNERFLCDVMLARLGKWLRAAGYDTLIIQDNRPDSEIYALAKSEQRILLTRDHHFIEMAKDDKNVIWFSINTLEDYIQELTKKLQINWLFKPFSRCLICNHLLILPPTEALKDLPEDVLQSSSHYWYCTHCQKIFWEGSHTKRMLQKLQSWDALPKN
jgi:uncharacterized protein with PIN domain